MEYNSKTQFKTEHGTTSVAAIANANAKSEQAAFELAKKLGIFGLWCKSKNFTVKAEFSKMADAAKIDPARVASLQTQVSHGIRLVRSGATFEGLQEYNEAVKVQKDKNGTETAKLTSPEGLQLKAGIEGFSAYAAQDLDGKKPKLVKASSGKVLDKAKADKADDEASKKKGPAPQKTHDTYYAGKGEQGWTLTGPIVVTAEGKKALREVVEKALAASGIESLYPDTAKVNA